MSSGKGGQRHLAEGLSIKNSALMRNLCATSTKQDIENIKTSSDGSDFIWQKINVLNIQDSCVFLFLN